ncbi:hypothetical protein [Paraglaciecola marina]|uniref:hypothetical protein n=1 Tax=Paraglaciecola marina TaxID=2500157 RepID=UPI00105CDFEC|nr:hypothetical protein [Paraglaciecola marina]
MNNIRSCISSVLLLLVFSGCATNVIEEFAKDEGYDKLYLRGVFSWWEADEQYKLKEVADQIYATRIDLIADGQPYDFKFADENWTPGLNCGYASDSNIVVKLGSRNKANCESIDNNFIFTPTETGTFEFSIDFGGFGSPKVSIKQIQ